MLALGISIVLGVIGIIASWWFSRYYYLKNKPFETSIQATMEAIRQERAATEVPGANRIATDVPPGKSRDVPLKWILALFEAYQNHHITMPELQVYIRTIKEIGEWIGDPFGVASQAANDAGQPLTPPWLQKYEEVVNRHIEAAKQAIQNRLKSKAR
jgi:hypothetical protein